MANIRGGGGGIIYLVNTGWPTPMFLYLPIVRLEEVIIGKARGGEDGSAGTGGRVFTRLRHPQPRGGVHKTIGEERLTPKRAGSFLDESKHSHSAD